MYIQLFTILNETVNMKTTYNLSWLENAYENNVPLKYLYFWGHSKSKNQLVTNSCFSQWYESPFTVNGITYKTTEHWMMAEKALLFENDDIYRQIIQCNTAAEAKKLGRQVSGFIDGVWNQHRYSIVRTGNIHKFNQNRSLGEYLLNTKNRVLVEASPVDPIWGIGLSKDSKDINNIYSWRGLNLLGFALMEVRDFLKSNGFFKNTYSFKPPWIHYPNIHPYDLHWRMGEGETFLSLFWKQFNLLSDTDKVFYKLYFPAPFVWKPFYNEHE